MSFIRKFIKDKKGAIAVETAIALPIMLFAFLRALDIGLQVHTMQNMNKATKSGTEYIVKGGRDGESVIGIMSDAYGKQLTERDISIVAYCACVEENKRQDDQADETGTEFGGAYVKTKVVFGEDMCPASCDSGNEISTLVAVTFKQDVQGTLGSKTLTSNLQTRVQ